MILLKGQFSDLVILEMCGYVYRKEYKQETLTQIETQNTKKQNTSKPQQYKTKAYAGTLNKFRINKENHDGKDDYITISLEPRMKKIQGRNQKSKQIITKYPNLQHH